MSVSVAYYAMSNTYELGEEISWNDNSCVCVTTAVEFITV